MKNPVIKILASVIILAIGIVFIVLGAKNISQINTFPQVSAVVSEVVTETSTDADGNDTTEETVYVSYTVNGNEYNEILQYAEGSYNKGDSITVQYNPENPSYVIGATKKGGIIRIAFGCVLALAGSGFFLRPLILVMIAKRKEN